MIKTNPLMIEDLETLDLKWEFPNLKENMQINLYDISKTIMSLKVEEKTIALVGINRFRPGAGEVWIIPGKEVDDHKWGFHKTIRSLIEYCFAELLFNRIEIAIKKGWDKGYKWAKSLGFKYQGVCEAYDSTYEDHIIFYKVDRRWQQVQQQQ